MKTLYIASWGDPGGWSETVYKPASFPEKPTCRPSGFGEGEAVKSWCTVDAVASGFSDLAGAYVFVPDTLAFSSGIGRWAAPPGCVFDHYGGDAWAGLERCVREYVMGVVESKGLSVEVGVDVVPGSGSFKRGDGLQARFRSHPWNLEAALYLDVLKALRRVGGDVLLVVDVSHGMNYLPVLMVRVAEKALAAYVLEAEARGWLVAVQSDPVIRGMEGEEHTVYPVYCRILDQDNARRISLEAAAGLAGLGGDKPYNLYPDLARAARELVGDRLRRLGEAFSTVSGVSRSVVNAAKGGLVLPLLYRLAGTRGIGDAVRVFEDAFAGLSRFTLLGMEGGFRVYTRPVSLRPQLVDAHLLAMHALKVLDRAGSLEDIVEEGVGLGALKAVGASLIPDGMGRSLFSREVSGYVERVSIYTAVCGAPGGWASFYAAYRLAEWQTPRNERVIDVYRGLEGDVDAFIEEARSMGILDELRGFCGLEPGGGGLDDRVFYAHAGMNSNAVEFSVRGGDVRVRYRGEYIEPALNLLEKA